MTQFREHLLWALLVCGSLLTVSGLLRAKALGLKAVPPEEWCLPIFCGHSRGINKTRQLLCILRVLA